MKWRLLDGTQIKSDLKAAIDRKIVSEKEAGHKLKVCIGTDSQVYGPAIEFATVIVFIREGKGGTMFISNEKRSTKMSIKERLLTVVARSIEVAYSICDLLDKYKYSNLLLKNSNQGVSHSLGERGAGQASKHRCVEHNPLPEQIP